MTWRILADAVLVLHFAFIGFALFGGLFARRWPRLYRDPDRPHVAAQVGNRRRHLPERLLQLAQPPLVQVHGVAAFDQRARGHQAGHARADDRYAHADRMRER